MPHSAPKRYNISEMSNNLDKYSFINPSKGEMKASKMISEIAGFIDEEPASFYRIVIGTDSQTRRNNGKTQVDFVTAIIVHRKGRCG